MGGGAWQTAVQVLGNTSYQVLIKSVKLLSYYQRTFSTCNINRRKHTSPDLTLNERKKNTVFSNLKNV